MISFLLLALIVYYFVVLPVQKLVDRFAPTPHVELAVDVAHFRAGADLAGPQLTAPSSVVVPSEEDRRAGSEPDPESKSAAAAAHPRSAPWTASWRRPSRFERGWPK